MDPVVAGPAVTEMLDGRTGTGAAAGPAVMEMAGVTAESRQAVDGTATIAASVAETAAAPVSGP
jgi:hypothetical protein